MKLYWMKQGSDRGCPRCPQTEQRRIVKRDAHPAIVNLDNWQYAFDHLSRDDGSPVIDGVSGAHVYYHLATQSYRIKQWEELAANVRDTSIYTKNLDKIVEDRLLHWLSVSERRGQDWISISGTVKGNWLVSEPVKGEQTPHKAMDKVEQNTQPQPQSSIQGDLELTNQDLARIERRLYSSEDVMSDEDLRETYAKKARLLKRRAELEKVIDQKEKLAGKQEQGKKDVETAGEKWAGWSIEERRSFIRLVTESITLEEIASGWLRLTLVWSPIMGFVYPLESNTRAVDTAYIWREFGAFWTEDELAQLRAHYPTMGRAELLHLLPNRSWQSNKR